MQKKNKKLAIKSKYDISSKPESFYSRSVNQQCSSTEYPIEVALGNFTKWLLSMSSGNKGLGCAQQHTSRVGNIFKCIGLDDALDIKTNYKLIEEQFIKRRKDPACPKEYGGPLVATSFGPYM